MLPRIVPSTLRRDAATSRPPEKAGRLGPCRRGTGAKGLQAVNGVRGRGWGVRECPVFGVLGAFFSGVDWGWRVEAQVSLGGLVYWLARQLVVVSSV